MAISLDWISTIAMCLYWGSTYLLFPQAQLNWSVWNNQMNNPKYNPKYYVSQCTGFLTLQLILKGVYECWRPLLHFQPLPEREPVARKLILHAIMEVPSHIQLKHGLNSCHTLCQSHEISVDHKTRHLQQIIWSAVFVHREEKWAAHPYVRNIDRWEIRL